MPDIDLAAIKARADADEDRTREARLYGDMPALLAEVERLTDRPVTIIDSRAALEALPVGAIIRRTEPDEYGDRTVLERGPYDTWYLMGGPFTSTTVVVYGIEHNGARYELAHFDSDEAGQ